MVSEMTINGTLGHVFKQLEHLKLAQLQRLAVSLGTSCSGTKLAIKSSIEQRYPRGRITRARPLLSLVSIDMGIRNLAYAHLKTDLDLRPESNYDVISYQRPRLCAWEKIAVAPPAAAEPSRVHTTKDSPQAGSRPTTKKRAKRTEPESFAPSIYASHAVNLITGIIDKHHPTHILIERQRFRSGGSPIVQDWSIRVGVFEGMLYAVLKTLSEKLSIDVEIEGVDPTKVNRFWLSLAPTDLSVGSKDSSAAVAGAVPKGKAMKKMKIDIVGQALEESLTARKKSVMDLEIDNNAMPMAGAYLSKWTKESRRRLLSNINHDSGSSDTAPDLDKLDDLADCLLQGMAWIEWENNRARLAVSEDV